MATIEAKDPNSSLFVKESCHLNRKMPAPPSAPGRFTPLEFGTHNFNNWLLDRVLGDGRWDWKARVRPPQGGSWAMSDFGEAELAFGGLLLCLLVLAARGFRPLGRRRGTGGNRSRGGGVK